MKKLILILPLCFIGCATPQTRQHLSDAKEKLAEVEARYASEGGQGLSIEVEAAKIRVRELEARVRAEKKASFGWLAGLLEDLFSGASPVFSVLLPGSGVAFSGIGKLLNLVKMALIGKGV